MKDAKQKERMEGWRVQSPDAHGFHKVVTPDTCECKEAQIFRLNLAKGDSYTLESGALEMNVVVISGGAKLSGHDELNQEMERFDSFYIPGGNSVAITATEELIIYIGAAKCEGYGKPYYRKYDPTLPIGELHQIHGAGVGRREVMFTLDTGVPASRLICGLTWGGQGAWTSWPPHQHEKDLEEVYCYFDMPAPKFGFHISYLESGKVEDIVTHVVQSGTMVQAPAGYHPTVASPTVQNTYFWVLASFSHESLRYDLAVLDPIYEND